MANVGKAEVVLTATDKASKKIKGIGKTINTALNVAGIYIGFKLLSKAIGANISKYNLQQKADIQLATALKSTGNVINSSTEALKAHASALQKVTTFGDEEIQSAQALLLTFKNIGEETFPMTTEAVMDIATALGTDLKSASIQVGKALNDPATGLTMLSRSGITFTEDQKKVIKALWETGKHAEAQKIILGELSSQFGGSARAQALSFGGAITQVGNNFGDLQEKIGEVIGGALTPYTIAFAEMSSKMVEGFNETGEASNKASNSIEKISSFISKLGLNFLKVKNFVQEFGLAVGMGLMKEIAGLKATIALIERSLLKLKLAFLNSPLASKKAKENIPAVKREIAGIGDEIKLLVLEIEVYEKSFIEAINKNAKAVEEYSKGSKAYFEAVNKAQKEAIRLAKEREDREKKGAQTQTQTAESMKNNLDTIKGIQAEIKKYQDLLSELNISSNEFADTTEKIIELETRLAEALGKTGGGIEEQKTSLENFATLLDGIVSKTARTFDIFSGLYDQQKEKLADQYDLEKEKIEESKVSNKSKADLLEELDQKYLEDQKKVGKKMKKIKLAQAISNVALGITTALAKQDYFGAILIGIAGGIEIATIASSEYARGGIVQGVGSTTSDMIPAFLSRGEAVIPSDVVKNYPDEVESLIRGENRGGNLSPVIINAGGKYERFLSMLFDDVYQASKEGRLFIDQRADIAPALI